VWREGRSQIFSNASVNAGVGIYWMFYSGGSYERVPSTDLPPGLPSQDDLEGLR
jgi:hypothetical protein